MLSEADRKKCADILENAQKEHKQATPFSQTFPSITIEDSYAISAEDARRIMGHKSREIEALLGYRGRDEMIHRDDLVLR